MYSMRFDEYIRALKIKGIPKRATQLLYENM